MPITAEVCAVLHEGEEARQAVLDRCRGNSATSNGDALS